MAAERLAPANKHVIIYCDNQTTVSIINKGTTPNVILMPYFHWLFWLPSLFDFRITAHHIPGRCSFIADGISRLHDHHFLLIAFAYVCMYFPVAYVYA